MYIFLHKYEFEDTLSVDSQTCYFIQNVIKGVLRRWFLGISYSDVNYHASFSKQVVPLKHWFATIMKLYNAFQIYTGAVVVMIVW
jgi:hypothetical protein